MRCRPGRRATARTAIGSAALLTAGLLTGCGSKVAGPTLVLQLASPDEANVATTSMQVGHFAEQVAARSRGTIRIDIRLNVDEGALGWDQIVAAGVADGTWDLGLVPGRAWDVLRVDSLRALSAPFLVNTPAALETVLNSDARGDLLAGLPAAGVVGLDIFPDGMRHPFGYEQPLLGPADYTGATIRTGRSEASAAFFQELGASVTDAPPSQSDQRGAESQFSITPAGIATGNVTFFAKTDVLVADADLRRRVRQDQWEVLRDAAAATRSWMFAQQPSDFEAAATFCSHGGRVVAASPEQVAGLRAVGARVVEQMREDTGTRRMIDRLRGLIAGLPAPTPLTGCPGTAAGASTPTGAADDPELALLDGTYRTEVTTKALQDAGARDKTAILENSGRFTWTLDGGRWTYRQQADHFVSRTTDSGRFTYHDGLFTLFWSNGGWTKARVRVSPDGTIHFTDVVDRYPSNQGLSEGFFSAPWTRIGGVSP